MNTEEAEKALMDANGHIARVISKKIKESNL